MEINKGVYGILYGVEKASEVFGASQEEILQEIMNQNFGTGVFSMCKYLLVETMKQMSKEECLQVFKLNQFEVQLFLDSEKMVNLQLNEIYKQPQSSLKVDSLSSSSVLNVKDLDNSQIVERKKKGRGRGKKNKKEIEYEEMSLESEVDNNLGTKRQKIANNLYLQSQVKTKKTKGYNTRSRQKAIKQETSQDERSASQESLEIISQKLSNISYNNEENNENALENQDSEHEDQIQLKEEQSDQMKGQAYRLSFTYQEKLQIVSECLKGDYDQVAKKYNTLRQLLVYWVEQYRKKPLLLKRMIAIKIPKPIQEKIKQLYLDGNKISSIIKILLQENKVRISKIKVIIILAAYGLLKQENFDERKEVFTGKQLYEFKQQYAEMNSYERKMYALRNK